MCVCVCVCVCMIDPRMLLHAGIMLVAAPEPTVGEGLAFEFGADDCPASFPLNSLPRVA